MVASSPERARWPCDDCVRLVACGTGAKADPALRFSMQTPTTARWTARSIEGLRLFDLSLRGKTVLLKPNLVEYIPGTEVNTDPRLVGAAASAFLALGAKSVLVGEGPGHQRDTFLVLAESGLEKELQVEANPVRRSESR